MEIWLKDACALGGRLIPGGPSKRAVRRESRNAPVRKTSSWGGSGGTLKVTADGGAGGSGAEGPAPTIVIEPLPSLWWRAQGFEVILIEHDNDPPHIVHSESFS